MEADQESKLIQVFGESPFTKVLDTLMDHPTYDYTKKELAEVNDISRSTLYRIWDRLENNSIVKPTKKVGSTQLYRLNPDSDVVKQLYEFEKSLEDGNDTEAVEA